MQAVILAAGLGTRLRPFTLTTPKTLIPIGEKTLIEHTLDALPNAIDEIFVVVNYLGDQIKSKIGDSHRGISIRYVTQEPLNGTGGAMMLLRNQLHDRFLVVNGDDLYSHEALEKMMSHQTSILLCPTDMHLMNGGQLDTQGKFIGLVESITNIQSYRVCGAYVLDRSYFDIGPVKIQGSRHEEFGLPQTLAVQAIDKPIEVVLTTEWFPIGTPEELSFANKKLSTISS